MHAPELPEAWEIEELNRMRRIGEREAGEALRLPLPAPFPASRDAHVPMVEEKRVIVIDVW